MKQTVYIDKYYIFDSELIKLNQFWIQYNS